MENYKVEIKEKYGSCENKLFEKMAQNGDLNSIKLKDIINAEITIQGYALCNITTKDKNFNMNYIDTEEYGLISSGSEIFIKSVKLYINDAKLFRIKEIKTSKGVTYKVFPVLENHTNEVDNMNVKDDTNEELPF